MRQDPIRWLITDMHINHDKMLKVGRPADYVERMISQCARMVRPQDTLINLGDVIFYHSSQLVGLMARIPGRKILVRGNHDKKSNTWFERNGFDFVADAIVLGSVVLSHKPLLVFPDGVQHNIHGHFHDNDHRSADVGDWYDPRKHFKLAVEETDYAPVRMDQLLRDRMRRSA